MVTFDKKIQRLLHLKRIPVQFLKEETNAHFFMYLMFEMHPSLYVCLSLSSVCVRASVRACVCVCVPACKSVCLSVCVHVCVFFFVSTYNHEKTWTQHSLNSESNSVSLHENMFQVQWVPCLLFKSF